MNFIEKRNKNEKNTPDVPKNESGLIQMIRMENSVCHIWFKQFPYISRHSTSIYMVIKTAFEVHMTCIAVPCVLINHS